MGAAALDLFGALAGMLDRRSSGPSQEDLEGQRQRDELDARAAAEGAALAEMALKAAQAGQYAAARDGFRRAYERSSKFEYQRDMVAMDALLHLQEAIGLASKKRPASAYTEFMKAEALAKEAGRPDIAQRIDRLRTDLWEIINKDDLARDAQGARDASKRLSTQCVPVNGEFVCD